MFFKFYKLKLVKVEDALDIEKIVTTPINLFSNLEMTLKRMTEHSYSNLCFSHSSKDNENRED